VFIKLSRKRKNNMKNFTQKVAVITGAGSGIGRALAIQLAKEGCHLALSDVNEVGLDETKALITQINNKDYHLNNIKISLDKLDVAQRQAVHDYADKMAREHGKINLIFNNAGVSLIDNVESMSYDDFEWLININFWGVVHGTKAFLPYLKQADEGHIINISSLFGLMAIPSQSAYNASKFAVRGFTEALKMELTHSNVNVSSVHPGGIQTSIVDNSRVNEATSKYSKSHIQAIFKKQAITTAEQAAEIILTGVQKNQRRILVGKDARMADKIIRWFPNSYEKRLNLEKLL